MLTTGNILIPQMRNPVASSNKPPTALKSAIIDGVVSGKISAAAHASVNWMISNGILITDTAIPSEQAKIIAVKKSRNDLAIKILGSPVIPSFIAPKDPGAAGAKQDNNRDIILNKRFMRWLLT